MSFTKDDILSALASVTDPASGRSVTEAGIVSAVTVKDGGRVGFVLTITPQQKDQMLPLREQCEQAVRKVAGVQSVTAVMTAQNDTPIPPKPEAGYTDPRARAQWNLTPLPNVGRVIAVASGKGGVGKSTTTVNLALALAQSGQVAGLLDADIYGPSIPRMLNLSGQPEVKGGKMQPMRAHGVRCMSMGFITGDEAAILRGPMISKSLQQMLRMTHWADDKAPMHTLFVDMPPGTGDIHLSLVQQVPLSGAIIVTTPQEVALSDARKCAKMFEKVGVPILGIIENMSWFEDPSGAKHMLFGSGGGQKLADEFGVKLLGQIPLIPALREAGDSGTPATASLRYYQDILTRLG